MHRQGQRHGVKHSHPSKHSYTCRHHVTGSVRHTPLILKHHFVHTGRAHHPMHRCWRCMHLQLCSVQGANSQWVLGTTLPVPGRRCHTADIQTAIPNCGQHPAISSRGHIHSCSTQPRVRRQVMPLPCKLHHCCKTRTTTSTVAKHPRCCCLYRQPAVV